PSERHRCASCVILYHIVLLEMEMASFHLSVGLVTKGIATVRLPEAAIYANMHANDVLAQDSVFLVLRTYFYA
ncbi:hypothetical protein H0H93_010752, partial [Arthromyces matolae]